MARETPELGLALLVAHRPVNPCCAVTLVKEIRLSVGASEWSMKNRVYKEKVQRARSENEVDGVWRNTHVPQARELASLPEPFFIEVP